MHQLVDDLDGTLLDVGDGETVLFSLDGIAYEIDLSDDNARALRDALAPYTGAGRSISSSRGASARRTAKASGPQRDLSDVRAWAKSNGHQISERGRVPAAILEAYDAAH